MKTKYLLLLFYIFCVGCITPKYIVVPENPSGRVKEDLAISQNKLPIHSFKINDRTYRDNDKYADKRLEEVFQKYISLNPSLNSVESDN